MKNEIDKLMRIEEITNSTRTMFGMTQVFSPEFVETYEAIARREMSGVEAAEKLGVSNDTYLTVFKLYKQDVEHYYNPRKINSQERRK